MFCMSSSWYLIMISIHPHSKLPSLLQWLETCCSDYSKLEVILRSGSTDNGMYAKQTLPGPGLPTTSSLAGREGGKPGEFCSRALWQMILVGSDRSPALFRELLCLQTQGPGHPCLAKQKHQTGNVSQYLLPKTQQGIKNWFSSFFFFSLLCMES